MAIEKEINLNVNSNIEGSIGQLKALKRELKGVDVGTEEFKKLYNQIDDLEDKIKSAKNKSSDWIDSLASAGGPLGMVGTGLNSLKVSTQSFGAALKATGIGLIVIALGGLAAAFSQNDNAMKKIKPLLDGMQKILQGIFKAVEPLLDAFLDLAMKALPYVTQGIGLFYSALVGLFTLVKEVGGGYIKMMKGIVTLDFDAAKEGFNQIKDGFSKAVKSGEEAYARFQAGSKEQTASEKEELAKRREEEKKHQDELAKKQKDANDKAKEERKKAEEAEKERLKLAREQELKDNAKYWDDFLRIGSDKVKTDYENKKAFEEADAELTKNIAEDKLNKLKKELADKEEAAKKEEEFQKNKDTAIALSKQNLTNIIAGLEDSGLAKTEAGQVIAKTLALTQIGIDSAVAISKASTLANAEGVAAQLAFPLVPGIGTIARIVSYASTAAGVISNITRAKQLLSSGGSGGGGSAPSSAAPSAPAAPSFNVVGNSGVNQVANVLNNQGMPPIKTYVTAGEVTTQQGLNRNIVSNATLG
jgi:hypothetical protein